MDVGDAAAYDFGTSDFSITGWFKTTMTGEGSIIAKRQACNGDNRWDINFGGDGAGLIGFVASEDANANHFNVVSSVLLNDDFWHHFVAIREGTEGRLYIDGALDGTDDTGSGIADLSDADEVTIGQSACGYFDGEIDDVRVYNRALNEDEIKFLASPCNNPGRPPGTMLYNSDFNVMQYCNGMDWIGIGK